MANSNKLKFKVGVNLLRPTKDNPNNELRFEAGDVVPKDVTDKEIKALRELDAIED